MPDHLHLLVQIRSVGLVDVVWDLKSRSTRLWWQHGGSGTLWQRSFRDRGIRDPGEYQRVVDYILDNPMKRGLVTHWQDYPWLGGRLFQDFLLD